MNSHPYADQYPVLRGLPSEGRDRGAILAELREMATQEDSFWQTGKASGSFYCGDMAHYAFMSEAFGLYGHMNALQRDVCPSATRFEGEIIAMGLDLFNAGTIANGDPVGMITSGGSASILHAVLSYREHARATRGITSPNFVKPETGHPAFDKACHLLGIELRIAPIVPATAQVDLEAVAGLIDEQTIAILGSASNYGYGTIDDIAALGQLALSRGVGLHVDGCLGGFILPFGEKLGFPIPKFDFRVPGVTTISADTHKYGYALKGTSVLLYRDSGLRKYQYFNFTDWPGGIYFSPGLSGSRSGGIVAATWAAMVSLGERGYLEVAKGIFEMAATIRHGIDAIPELEVIGQPTFLVAFRSPDLNIYHVNDHLIAKGWRLNALQLPAALHFCVTRPNTAPGVADAFLADLRDAVDYAKHPARSEPRSGALYGLGGTPEGNEILNTLFTAALDAMYEVAPTEARA